MTQYGPSPDQQTRLEVGQLPNLVALIQAGLLDHEGFTRHIIPADEQAIDELQAACKGLENCLVARSLKSIIFVLQLYSIGLPQSSGTLLLYVSVGKDCHPSHFSLQEYEHGDIEPVQRIAEAIVFNCFSWLRSSLQVSTFLHACRLHCC